MSRQSLNRAYRTGDLIEIVKTDENMFVKCPTGQAVVLRASDWHCVKLTSNSGGMPAGVSPYYQILKVMSNGRSYYNIHSHNVKLLSANETS